MTQITSQEYSIAQEEPLNSASLHKLAHTQRNILKCLLGQYLPIPLLFILIDMPKTLMTGILGMFVIVIIFFSFLGNIFFTLRAFRLRGYGILERIVTCVFMFTCFNIFILLYIISSITGVLRRNGVEVGFLGAKLSTLPPLVDPT